MKIRSLDIFEYQLPLKKPLSIKNYSFKVRRGLILRLRGENNTIGFGEIAPLPGLSPEELMFAAFQLLELSRQLKNDLIPGNTAKLSGQFERWLGSFNLAPSVRFGIETAVLSLLADVKRVPLSRLINPSASKTIFISGLLQGSKDEVCREAQALLSRRFKSFKLKVGSNSVDEDIEKVVALCKLIKNRASLRLDANKVWDLDTAVAFGKAIEETSIDYIEEPLAETVFLNEFYQKTKLPIALDESLYNLAPGELETIKGLRAVVLKPSIIGGFEKTFEWVRAAEKLKIQAVISSAFESGLGQTVLANLAGAIGKSPAGLDTLKWFEQDILKGPSAFTGGALRANELRLRANNIQMEMLRQISDE